MVHGASTTANGPTMVPSPISTSGATIAVLWMATLPPIHENRSDGRGFGPAWAVVLRHNAGRATGVCGGGGGRRRFRARSSRRFSASECACSRRGPRSPPSPSPRCFCSARSRWSFECRSASGDRGIRAPARHAFWAPSWFGAFSRLGKASGRSRFDERATDAIVDGRAPTARQGLLVLQWRSAVRSWFRGLRGVPLIPPAVTQPPHVVRRSGSCRARSIRRRSHFGRRRETRLPTTTRSRSTRLPALSTRLVGSDVGRVLGAYIVLFRGRAAGRHVRARAHTGTDAAADCRLHRVGGPPADALPVLHGSLRRHSANGRDGDRPGRRRCYSCGRCLPVTRGWL